MITLNIDNGAPKQDLYLLLQSNEILRLLPVLDPQDLIDRRYLILQ